MRLIASQHPRWAGLPVERVASDGTTNAIYRLGPSAAVRLPLVRYGEEAIDVEGHWLPRIAPGLPLAAGAALAIALGVLGFALSTLWDPIATLAALPPAS